MFCIFVFCFLKSPETEMYAEISISEILPCLGFVLEYSRKKILEDKNEIGLAN